MAAAESQDKSSRNISNQEIPDGFMSDGKRKIDFILVYEKFSNHNEMHIKRRLFFERRLELNGLQMETEEVSDAGKCLVFVKLHVPWSTLCSVAEDLKLKTPLWLHDRPILIKQSWFMARMKKLFNCNFFVKPKGLTREQRGKNYITWPFSVQIKDRYAIKDRQTFFSTIQRIEIVWEVLQKTQNDFNNKRSRGLEELLAHKIYTAAFPLHEGDACQSKTGYTTTSSRKQLLSTWASWRQIFRPQPLSKVQQYFGHKIAFYFAFLDFYLKMLIFPAIAGLLAILYGYLAHDTEIEEICSVHEEPGNYIMCPVCKPPDCDPWRMADSGCLKYKTEYRLDNEAALFLSCFTIIWGIIFLKMWKRKEARYAAIWDCIDIKLHQATVRPGYTNTAPLERINLVTTKMEPHWPFYFRAMRIFVSILITATILCFAVFCLFLILISRVAMYGAFKRAGGFWTEHSLSAPRFLTSKFVSITVFIFELVYSRVSFRLTNFERPKTHRDFMNSLLCKLFVFKLFNSFIPISYSAWVRGKLVKTPADLNYYKELCDSGCMTEIVELIANLLIFRLILENIIEIFLPFTKNFIKRCKNSSLKEHRLLSRWLKDFHMGQVELDGVYKDYMEMVVQFAFVIFCVSAFPATAFVCFINNIFEIRIDAIKLLKSNRRPLPERVRGIQIWYHFLDTIVKIGIIFNAALIAFTSGNLPKIFYVFHYMKSLDLHGYTAFSLSRIDIEAYKGDSDSYAYLKSKNITSCWYIGFRENERPYHMRADYWRIVTFRLAVFATYIIVFYTLMWFVNTFINDVPADVKIRMQRRKHVVMKALQAEGGLKKKNFINRRKNNLNHYLYDDCMLMCSVNPILAETSQQNM